MTKIIGKFLILMTTFIFFAAGTIYAQTQDYKDYTVKKGDTLWNISSKEVSDPFLWPKIWKENPQIKNPDLIYPGQTIRIPEKLMPTVSSPPLPPLREERVLPLPRAAEVKPQPTARKEETGKRIETVEKEYLVDGNTLMSSGYIAEVIESSGEVMGSPSQRTALGKDDFVYIRTARPVKAGDKFYVIRSLGEVSHPETNIKMGYLIDVLGIAEVVGMESGEVKAKIVASFDAILTGDLLTDFYVVEPPFLVDTPRMPDVGGFIVATKKMRILNGMLNVVYIDKGRGDGLEVGDVLGTLSRDQYTIPNGSLQVISMRDKTATAIIRKSHKEVLVEDIVSPAQGRASLAELDRTQTLQQSSDNEVTLFIDQFTGAYEAGDIDRFMSLFSASAIENNSLRYDDIRREYEKHFRGNRYKCDLKNVQTNRDNNNIILKGAYIIRSIEGKAPGSETRGNITWTLARENSTLKIIRMDYDRF